MEHTPLQEARSHRSLLWLLWMAAALQQQAAHCMHPHEQASSCSSAHQQLFGSAAGPQLLQEGYNHSPSTAAVTLAA
jgi:hypothetical protein